MSKKNKRKKSLPSSSTGKKEKTNNLTAKIELTIDRTAKQRKFIYIRRSKESGANHKISRGQDEPKRARKMKPLPFEGQSSLENQDLTG